MSQSIEKPPIEVVFVSGQVVVQDHPQYNAYYLSVVFVKKREEDNQKKKPEPIVPDVEKKINN